MLKKLIYILGKKRFILYLVLALFMIVGALLDSITTYLVLPFVYALMEPEKFAANDSVQEVLRFLNIKSSYHMIGAIALTIAGLYLVRNVYMIILNKLKYGFIADSRTYLATKLFKCVSDEKYSFFKNTNTAAIQRLCINDIDRTLNTIDSIMIIVLNGLTVLATAILLFVSDPILTIFSCAVVGGMAFFVNLPISRYTTKLAPIYTQYCTNMLSWVQQFMGGLKTILTSGKQEFFVNRFSENSAQYADNNRKYYFFSLVSGYVTNGITMAAVFAYMAVLAFTGNDIAQKLPILALFALSAVRLLPSVSTILSYVNFAKYNQEGAEYIYERMKELGTSGNDVVKKDNTSMEKLELSQEICVENLSFSFDDSETPLFQNVSLQIPAQKAVAFVGTTGSGKTTMADLILGLYAPTTGKITVDGIDIRLHKREWENTIGYIPQSVYLLEDTILANVAFGVEKQDIDEARAWECLKDAQMDSFVKSLPEGIMTVTGENGVKLSGGQKQRIGIARALYGDPKFLVLDEATSALDNDTEKAIMEVINNFAGEKTLLIIAHRLSTIEHCDIVYQIEDGKVQVRH